MAPSLVYPTIALVAILAAGCGGSPAALDLSPSGAQGRQIAAEAGCPSCHGDRGQGTIGPAWVGLAGGTVELGDGTTTIADDAYLHRAISDPQADIVVGYTLAMPENALTDDEIDAVISYIKELR